MELKNGKLARSIKTCLIYDHRTGQIYHSYQSVTLEGGKEPTAEEFERRARELAVKSGRDPAQIGVLHVASDRIQARKRYAVDLTNQALIEVEVPRRR